MDKHILSLSPMLKLRSGMHCILLLMAFTQCLSFHAYAGEETFNSRAAGAAVKSSLVMTVSDDKFDFMETYASGTTQWQDQFVNNKVLNKIIFSIDHTSNDVILTDYAVDLELKVVYYTWNDVTKAFVANTISPNPHVRVTYSASNNYQDKAVYQFEGGHKMEVSIVNAPDDLSTHKNLSLETEIQVTRFYAFDNTQLPIMGYNTLEASRGELEVYWNFVEGAEEYDLEWTHVNNYGENISTLLQPQDIAINKDLFRFNSTRISTSNNFYRIPLLYEKGYIVFRVRAVVKNPGDSYQKNIYGKWSSYPDTYTRLDQFTNKYQMVEAHQANLNWQNSVSFAEEGKRKVVVSYYDGSLRNRQVVSQLNTKDQTIVGETIYDYQGRAAIQVLPVPVNDQKIQYHPDFNLNTNGLPYSKEDFDVGTGADACKPAADPMKTSSGASNYYSPDNANQTGQQKYVPDANGYPFTQVEYTPDNTGRVNAQTGVGDQHQLGSTHDNRYFYGKPQQEELDQLFGSEVGQAQHYKKNMVIDANGQISVSYLDPQGRVVATSLAGKTPDAVDALTAPDAAPVNMHIDLLNKLTPSDKDGKEQRISGTSKIYTTELLVSTEGDRTVNYSVTPSTFFEACTNANLVSNVCYDCVLDLRIVLTDNCGRNYLVNLDGVDPNSTSVTIGQSILTAMRTNNYNQLPSACETNPQTFNAPNWITHLPVGSYSISKVLTVNQEALDFYTNDFIVNNKCLLTEANFFSEEMKHIDLNGCAITCDQCLESLGEYEKYDRALTPACSPCLTQKQYDRMYQECVEFCEDKDVTCQSAYENMLIDVSPLGQYGGVIRLGAGNPDDKNFETDGSIHPEDFTLSIFNSANTLPYNVAKYNYRPSWKYPIAKASIEETVPSITWYFDESGQRSYKQLRFDENTNTYYPSIDLNKVGEIVLRDGEPFIPVEFLSNFTDFFFEWQPSWAQSLVIYHPEYASYEFCVSNSASHDFDNAWVGKDKVIDAPAGFMNPLGSSNLTSTDPYFKFDPVNNPTFEPNEYLAMKRAMEKYMTIGNTDYTIWQVAYATVNCPTFNASAEGSCTAGQMCATNVNSSTVFDDATWVTYRQLYYSLKKKFYDKKMIRYSVVNSSYNACIGDENFNPYSGSFASLYYNASANTRYAYYTQLYNFGQPCSVWHYRLFKDKKKRFIVSNDVMPAGIDADVCYDISSDGLYPMANCTEVTNTIIEEASAKGTFAYYQTCGQCTVVKSFEGLLNAVAKRPDTHLASTGLQLSCYPQNNAFVEFIPDLERALLLPGTGEVFWDVQSNNATSLNVNFRRGTYSCGMKLALKNSYSVTDNSTQQKVDRTFNWQDITDICCMHYITVSTFGLPVIQNKNFGAQATVSFEQADGTINTVKIEIEGYTQCIDLTCTPPVLCNVTPAARQLQNLMSSLLFSYPAQGDAPALPKKFLTAANESVLLDNDVTIPESSLTFYESSIGAALTAAGPSSGPQGNGVQWRWTGTGSNTTFTGTIKAVDLNGNITGTSMIELTLPAGVSINDIVSFTAIRPDNTVSLGDAAHSFTIHALVNYLDGEVLKQKYVLLSGYSSIVTGACEQAVFSPVTQN